MAGGFPVLRDETGELVTITDKVPTNPDGTPKPLYSELAKQLIGYVESVLVETYYPKLRRRAFKLLDERMRGLDSTVGRNEDEDYMPGDEDDEPMPDEE